MITADFPQADKFSGIIGIIEAVYIGKVTDVELEMHIGLDSKGRQGRYYRRAAVALGLIQVSDSVPVLTHLGSLLIGSTGPDQVQLCRVALAAAPVFAAVLDFINSSPRTMSEIRDYVISIYPGESGTAIRRTSTIKSYLLDMRLIDESNGLFTTTEAYALQTLSDVDSSGANQEGLVDGSEEFSGKKVRVIGFCPDAALRKAIENRAVDCVMRYYADLGFDVLDVGATHSFDLLVRRGEEERHVEVKGSQYVIESIILTKNEVSHARSFHATDLATVGGIQAVKSGDGIWAATGGQLSVMSDWTPSEEQLSPISYHYTLD